VNQRLILYKRLAAARRDDELATIADEMQDRFGPLRRSSTACCA